MEQLAEQMLIDIAAQAHHGELKKSGHRRRQCVGCLAALRGHVHDERACREAVQHAMCFGRVHVPALRGLRGAAHFCGAGRGQQLTVWDIPDFEMLEGATIATRLARAIATLHPAYLLRQPLQKRLAWRDFLAIKRALRDPS